MDDLDAEFVLGIGGWDAQQARVLLLASSGDDAIALIDADGDGLSLGLLTRKPGADWRLIRTDAAGDEGSGATANVDYAWGQASPGATVMFDHRGVRRAVIAAPTGWWAYIASSDSALIAPAAVRALEPWGAQEPQADRHDEIRRVGPSSLPEWPDRPDDQDVHAHAIIRVFCVDGPLHGLQYLDEDTGRILFEHNAQFHIYRVRDGERVTTDFGPCPAAYFDYTEPPDAR